MSADFRLAGSGCFAAHTMMIHFRPIITGSAASIKKSLRYEILCLRSFAESAKCWVAPCRIAHPRVALKNRLPDDISHLPKVTMIRSLRIGTPIAIGDCSILLPARPRKEAFAL
jgi:hypothetical protein